MKIYVKIICILTILFLVNTSTYAAEAEDISSPKDISVPIKYIFESKGGEVSWDAKNKMAIVRYQDKTLQLKIGSKVIISNGKTKVLKGKVTTANGRTILPISVLNQELSFKLSTDDCLKIIGVKFIDLLRNNEISEGSGLLSKTFSKYLSSENIAQLAAYFSSVQFDVTKVALSKNTVHQNLNIPVVIQQVNYNYTIRFDYDGKIDELNSSVERPQLQYTKPVYDDLNKYSQQQVTFGDGAWKLPATLTLPKGKGPFPVVILVHDSGPYDRDESLGALKPFRDIAVGLASKNIAVLRYEKRTLEHSTKSKLIGNFTMNEEFEQDTYAAAEYLKTVSVIDASNIIVLGHSQGGYVLPKILQDDNSGIFKAGIIMSGYTRPIYQVMQDQYEYLMNKGMLSKEQFEYFKGQVEMINGPSFDAAKLPEGYTLGNAYYFNSMKKYDVLGDAKALNRPMLVLQGERDYQVSVKTDFEAWKEAFSGKQEVEYKLYPKLNHFYTEGEGDSLPTEYSVSANIPQYVINDIAEFVNKAADK
ncbi:MAG: alpha/beta hydrolase family protein [Ruminiclostridium sp.]